MVICKAIRKHGWENFRVDVIECGISPSDVDARERFWISAHNSLLPNGYNFEQGGNAGKTVSEATRKATSLRQLGKKRGPMSEETKRKIGDANRGRKTSLALRRRLSEIGKQCSWFLKMDKKERSDFSRRAGKCNKGRSRGPKSEEWKAKMRVRYSGTGNPFYGKKHTNETKAKIAANRKDPRQSPGYHSKLSKAVKSWWAKRKEQSNVTSAAI